VRELIEVVNYQRHDWMNHIQVLLGYLKLEKYSMCEEYIQRMIQEANRDSLVARLELSSVVAYLLTFNALHREVRLEVEIPQPFSLARMESAEFLGDFILSVVKLYERHALYNDGEPNTLLLTLHYTEDKLRVLTDFAGCLDADRAIDEVAAIRQEAEESGGSFVMDLHTASESVLECTLPASLK
jgi:stage 0 sporulation protein B (sporulation initiation phosphotransferase)